MYLARFALDDQDFVQAVLRVGAEPLTLEEEQSWRRDIDRFLGALASLQPVWITQRIRLRRRELTRHWAVTVPVNGEQALLRWCAGLIAVACASRRSIDWVASRAEHDAVFKGAPQCMARLDPSLFEVGARTPAPAWIGGPLDTDVLLDPLIRQALVGGRDLLLQHTFTLRAPDLQTLRALKHNLARLIDLPGVGEDRLAAMRTIVNGYLGTTHVATVILAADGLEAESWMRDAVAAAVRDRPFAPEVTTAADWVEETELAINTDLHLDGLWAALASVPFAVLGNVLAWTPLNLPHEMFEWPVPTDPIDDAPDAAEFLIAPPSVGDSDPFVFVSYCRQDGHALSRILRALGDIGITPWWDHQIPGGSEWLQRLELRLDGCSAVVALVSEAAGRSRFVRNELTYAHILGKPVVPIKLDNAPLAAGLRIVLAHRNWIEAGDRDLVDALRRALTAASN